MAEPFLTELRLMSFNFPPKGWAFCDGQLLPINQNQAMFSLLGTTFGGNGQTNFALPDLRGRTAIHPDPSQGFLPGTRVGETAHTLLVNEIPRHQHTVGATSVNGSSPAPNVLAAANNVYAAPNDLTTLTPATVASVGGNQPHDNMSPYLTLNWCIALQGIFPSAN